MVEVGQRVRFVPYWNLGEYDNAKTKKAKSVAGVVTIVNAKHQVFWCEYAYKGVRQIETFKFVDIGDAVHVLK